MRTQHLGLLWVWAFTSLSAVAQTPGYPPPPPPNVIVTPGPGMQPPMMVPPPAPVMAPPVMEAPPAPVMVAPPPRGVLVPPGVVYIEPTYPRPAVGFLWRYHPRYGWGWYHPRRGWHQGWR